MASRDSFQKISTVSLTDEAQRQIREQILSGTFQPGDSLPDSVMAEQMGVSRSPVREALRLLEQGGLVEKATHRSYRVLSIDHSDLPELAALRIADEVLAVRMIVQNRTPIDSLHSHIDEMRSAGDAVEFAMADTDFHADTVALAGLPRLTSRYGALRDQIRLALSVTLPPVGLGAEHFLSSHEELYRLLAEALVHGNARDVISAWEGHVLAGMSSAGLLSPLV
ncbi:GntR family transcriptional regulator [Glaciibacter superstes]|uniref:GntR family transcriptional regulator n=1 Tax=Glaciibacter superstes TaxID=501023 RepID=UPI00041FF0F8|nr:GntR family transcriptional regulator [Glaciibacter superstes]